MMKRANKITALVVAAASIMSVVPTMAATKLGTKDGTIDRGVAFKDGKYLYEGYRTSDDDKGIYYNNGSDKDKKLDDATEIDPEFGKYGKDQVAVQDGNDKYIVDLSSGKISDDDTAGDLTTTAQAKLNTKLGKAERYGNGNSVTSVNSTIELIDSEDADGHDGYDQRDKFGDIWYAYAATSTGAAVPVLGATTTTAAGTTYTGYTNQAGAYIDCSKNANIYVFNGDKMVKIENIGDKVAHGTKNYDVAPNDVTLDRIKYIKTLGQDEKYLYRLVEVHVTGAMSVINPDQPDETLLYVQKISKAQDEKEKGAYLPKTTESFLLEAKDANSVGIGNGDVGDAWGELYGTNGANLGRATYIVDGSVYTTFQDDEKVKTVRVDLKTSLKLDRYDTNSKKYNNSSVSKIDSHVAAKNGDKDTKAKAWSVDVNGNVWAIYDGEIKESTKVGDFKTVYTCDRSLDSIDVYDENSLLAWDNSGDVYTNVREGQAQAKADAGTIVTPAKVGWEQLSDGNWTFYDATGTKVVNNWANAGGVWYFLDTNGIMATGWQQVNGSWYYLNPISDGTKGAMKTGWLNDNGIWYFLNSSGAMETGWKNINGYWYYLNPISDGTRGAMKTGWVNDNGTWYYLYSNGSMASNTIINGYKLSSSGALI